MLQVSMNGQLDLGAVGLTHGEGPDVSMVSESELHDLGLDWLLESPSVSADDLLAVDGILEGDASLAYSESELAWIEAQLEAELRFLQPDGFLPGDDNFEALATLEGAHSSIYEKLVEFGLLRKLTDIVMAKVSVPWHLREDARQEIHMAWYALRAKDNFERNQVAHYAYLAGQHAALKLRRTIGAVVVIPGALFRNGRDSAFMESIGAAVMPRDVEDFRDSMEISVDPEESAIMTRMSAEFFNQRVAGLQLTELQREVAYRLLVEQKTTRDIAGELGVQMSHLERLVTHVTNKIIARDTEEAEKKAHKARKTVAASRAATPRTGPARRRNPGRKPEADAPLDDDGARPARPRRRRLIASEGPSDALISLREAV